LLDALLFEWTNKTLAEQGNIIRRTPKGSHWTKLLVEESRDHMLELAKQMTNSAITHTLNDLRNLRNVADAFGDILYEEQELRKRRDSILSK
jgi:hypothetical protein